MTVQTQAPGEYRIQGTEGSDMWELATKAAALEGAETVDLANLLLDIPVGLRGALITARPGY